jgi:hypothetical protein
VLQRVLLPEGRRFALQQLLTRVEEELKPVSELFEERHWSPARQRPTRKASRVEENERLDARTGTDQNPKATKRTPIGQNIASIITKQPVAIHRGWARTSARSVGRTGITARAHSNRRQNVPRVRRGGGREEGNDGAWCIGCLGSCCSQRKRCSFEIETENKVSILPGLEEETRKEQTQLSIKSR